MSYEIKATAEGGMTITESHYKLTEDLVNVFPRCHSCDTERSYQSRIDMVDAVIRDLEAHLREQIAQEIKALNDEGLDKQLWLLVDVLNACAAIARGNK